MRKTNARQRIEKPNIHMSPIKIYKDDTWFEVISVSNNAMVPCPDPAPKTRLLSPATRSVGTHHSQQQSISLELAMAKKNLRLKPYTEWVVNTGI
jgi:hypothetical protein